MAETLAKTSVGNGHRLLVLPVRAWNGVLVVRLV
jgi:hypothetical protein